jgi:hypothetical protein
MHFNALICLVENYWSVAASNYSLLALLSLYFAHLWVNGTYVAKLSTPERTCLLKIQVFVALSKFIVVRLLTLNTESTLHISLEVKEGKEALFDYSFQVDQVETKLHNFSICKSDQDLVCLLRLERKMIY